MITSAVPVIAVSDSARSEDYYCRVLGFQRMFAYRPDTSKRDPCYLGVARDGVWLHLQSFKPERAGMTDAFLWVADVDLLYDEISARGAVIQLPPADQTWGTRETGIRDPDGNVLVFATKPPGQKCGLTCATANAAPFQDPRFELQCAMRSAFFWSAQQTSTRGATGCREVPPRKPACCWAESSGWGCWRRRPGWAESRT